MIDRVTYKQKFPTGVYLNCDIGFEASVPPGEDPLVVLKQLQDLSESFHKSSFSHLYTESGSPVEVRQVPDEPVVKMTNEERKQATINSHLKTINECKTLKNLEMFANLVQRENIDVLFEAYHQKKKELQNV